MRNQGGDMAARSDVLELAVLGLLHEAPMHGYELRKRLTTVLGPFRALSYGTLYPSLRRLAERGWISGSGGDEPDATRPASRRARVVYRLTPAGEERFAALVRDAGPASWEDESFDVRLAFFSRTAAEVRIRILEGRRSRLEERLEQVSGALSRSRERADHYTLALHRHGLESVQREVRWLNELISAERSRPSPSRGRPGTEPQSEPRTQPPTEPTPGPPSQPEPDHPRTP
jgi:DNA-binding PadR family transcriptional regulator